MSPTKIADTKKSEQLSPLYQQILKNIPIMPDTAAIPVPVAALHEGVSRRTIKRTYPLVKLSEHRKASCSDICGASARWSLPEKPNPRTTARAWKANWLSSLDSGSHIAPDKSAQVRAVPPGAAKCVHNLLQISAG
jgi:hypothetical protein